MIKMITMITMILIVKMLLMIKMIRVGFQNNSHGKIWKGRLPSV